MKRLQDGGTAFYPSKGAAIVLMAVGAVWLFVFWLIFGGTEGGSVVFKTLVSGVMVLVGVCFVGWGIKNLFWPVPVCVLYPEKICTGKREFLWEQVQTCFLREEWRGSGKNRQLCDILVFVLKAGAPAERTAEFYLLGKADRAALKREIELRGILFAPPQTVDLPFGMNFLKKIGFKKK